MTQKIHVPRGEVSPTYSNDGPCHRWESYERGVTTGTVRMIDEVLYYAWAVDDTFALFTFGRKRITWLPVEHAQIVK